MLATFEGFVESVMDSLRLAFDEARRDYEIMFRAGGQVDGPVELLCCHVIRRFHAGEQPPVGQDLALGWPSRHQARNVPTAPG